jgi:uncharacterized membrane protein
MASSRRRIDPRALSLALTTMVFPLCAGLGTRLLGPFPLICLLAVLLAARALLPVAQSTPRAIGYGLLAVAVLELTVSLWSPSRAARLYPVFMNAMMFVTFAATLFHPPSMIERFARVFEPELDARAIPYTRRVTQVWLGFFILNGGIALWTALDGTQAQWAIYNGAICYLLSGLLLGGEFLVRQRVRHDRVFP